MAHNEDFVDLKSLVRDFENVGRALNPLRLVKRAINGVVDRWMNDADKKEQARQERGGHG